MRGRLTPDFDDQDDCDLAPECPVCYAQMEWQDCDACGGDGEIDAYDDDPINESPGSFDPCTETVRCMRRLWRGRNDRLRIRPVSPPWGMGHLLHRDKRWVEDLRRPDRVCCVVGIVRECCGRLD